MAIFCNCSSTKKLRSLNGLLFPDKIYIHCRHNSKHKTTQCNIIHERRIEIFSFKFISKVFNKRVWQILFTEFFFYLPVPISKRTITPAIPDAKHKPTDYCYCQCNQMGLSGTLPYP